MMAELGPILVISSSKSLLEKYRRWPDYPNRLATAYILATGGEDPLVREMFVAVGQYCQKLQSS
jgi:hypothetical protein